MKLLKNFLRITTVFVICVVILVIIFFVFEITLAKVFPQSQLVQCTFLKYEQCIKRSDCYGYTIGGIGNSGAVHICDYKK
jgi:hypothetical protein